MALKWRVPPSTIANELRRRAAVIPDAVLDIGSNGASRWATQAKTVRPWTDRTGAARSGLTGEAQREGNNTVVYCYHTVEYGPYLEVGTSKMAPMPSIVPAFNVVGPQIVQDAKTVVQRIMGG